MKSNLLLPHRFKLTGLLIFLPGFAGGIAALFFGWTPEWMTVELPMWLPGVSGTIFQPAKNILIDEVALTFTMSGLLLMAFSREKQEDEFIRHTRLESLQWSFLISLVLFVVASWVVYNDWYWYVLIFNMISIPVFFLIRFHWVLYRAMPSHD